MRRFRQVDVFSALPLQGNPVAVVLDGDGLSTAQMERFTRWTNLSEATFLLPPTDPAADYQVRIFTQAGELPFAGHPTLGSCHAWLAAGGRPKDPDVIVQQCQVGLVRVRRHDGVLAFEAPPTVRSGPVAETDLGRVARILGIGHEDIVESRWADNGPGWVGIMLRSAEAVLAVRPTPDGRPFDIGVVGRYPEGAEAACEVRAFFTNERQELLEDPVTGSLNAALAQWLVGEQVLEPPYMVSQGTAMGRAGRVHIDQDTSGAIWVGGATRTVIEGGVELE
jgi:PhzF family phenazine biosynthesis protein